MCTNNFSCSTKWPETFAHVNITITIINILTNINKILLLYYCI